MKHSRSIPLSTKLSLIWIFTISVYFFIILSFLYDSRALYFTILHILDYLHAIMSYVFCNPLDCSPPGSSVSGILQARILECVAIPFSRIYSWLRDWPSSPALQADSSPSEPSGESIYFASPCLFLYLTLCLGGLLIWI